jgi:hypothetical protein
MRDQIESGNSRLQYSTDGELIGRLIKSNTGRLLLDLEPGFQLVLIPETGRVRVWGGKERKLIEFAK